MLAEDAEEPNSISTPGSIGCGQSISGANFSREHKDRTGEGSPAAYRQRRGMIGPLKCDRRRWIYDTFVMPKIDEESDDEDEELSKCECEG